MDLPNIDTTNTPNASRMLDTKYTVSHPTIQESVHWIPILFHEVFFNTTTLTPSKKVITHRKGRSLSINHHSVTPHYDIHITDDGTSRNFAPIEIEFEVEFEPPTTKNPTFMAFSRRISQQRHETSNHSMHTLMHYFEHKKHHHSSANLRKIASTTHRSLSINSNAPFGTGFSVRYLCTFGLHSLLMSLTFLLLFYYDCVVFFFVFFCYFYI
eukprot:64404_1